MVKKRKGIWFYGLAGSGKTYASRLLKNRIGKAFTIDGDVVRRHVSPDLGYGLEDRNIQIKRMFGITKIALSNGFFPIISSVSMNETVLKACKKNSIDVVEIIRPLEQCILVRELYENNVNVVGVDIKQKELETFKLLNDGSQNFEFELYKYVK